MDILTSVVALCAIFHLAENVLPKYMQQRKSCPMPFNVSVWTKAQEERNCFHSIDDDSSDKQEHVYHCVPSVFLNETIVFCGKNVPIQPGFCPIYNYNHSGINKVASYVNCSHFEKGCPTELYYSKDIYKHEACLQINVEDRCYLADPKCPKRSSQFDSTTETANNNHERIVTKANDSGTRFDSTTKTANNTHELIVTKANDNSTRLENRISGIEIILIILAVLCGLIFIVVALYKYVTHRNQTPHARIPSTNKIDDNDKGYLEMDVYTPLNENTSSNLYTPLNESLNSTNLNNGSNSSNDYVNYSSDTSLNFTTTEQDNTVIIETYENETTKVTDQRISTRDISVQTGSKKTDHSELQREDYNSEMIEDAITNGDLNALSQQLKLITKYNVNSLIRGRTPLCIAAENGHESMVEFLIYLGAGVNCKFNENALYIACKNNFKEVARVLLCHGADPNRCSNENGYYPIHIATELGHSNIVSKLLTYKARADVLSRDGVTPLCLAARKNDLTTLQIILQKTDVNLKSKMSTKALHVACKKGFTEIVNCLLDSGADTDVMTKDKRWPLCIAAKGGFVDVVDRLLAANADVNLRGKNGETALKAAVERGNKNIDVVEKLLESRANLHETFHDKYQVLHIASECGHDRIVVRLLLAGANIDSVCEKGETALLKAIKRKHSKVAEILIDRNAKIHIPRKDGRTAFLIGAENGCLSILKNILNRYDNRRSIDINSIDNHGITALYVAVQGNHGATVRLLLSKEADPNICNNEGNSPLHVSCELGLVKISELLLNNSAKVNQCNNKGKSPLMIAIEENHPKLVSFLTKYGAKIMDKHSECPLNYAIRQGKPLIVDVLLKTTKLLEMQNSQFPLHLACEQEDSGIVQILIEHEADVNLRDTENNSPLIVAVKNNRLSAARMLLENNVAVNMPCMDQSSPLHIACDNRNVDMTMLLLQNNADISLTDGRGESPFFLASKNGSDDLIEIFRTQSSSRDALKQPKVVNQKSRDGTTALIAASRGGHVKVVQLLLKNYAQLIDVNCPQNDGSTALFLAAKEGHVEIVKLLIRYKANVNICKSQGESPLLVAVENGHETIVDVLLRSKAHIDVQRRDGSGILLAASRNGNENILRLLLLSNANIAECENESRVSPFYYAIEQDNDTVSEILIQSGANPNVKWETGKTPLLLATERGNTNIVKTLLLQKADVTQRNLEGKTALEIAKEKNFRDIYDLLKAKYDGKGMLK